MKGYSRFILLGAFMYLLVTQCWRFNRRLTGFTPIYLGDNRSFWHDLGFKSANHRYRAVIEIPKFSRIKFEMKPEVPLNPILPDVCKKDQSLARELSMPMGWNYGFIPQTLEDPAVKYEGQYPGDGDPLDVVEISAEPVIRKTGEILEVQCLGALKLIDQGEMDWKLIVSTLPVSETFLQTELQKIATWFSNYKIYEGLPANEILGFISGPECQQLIADCHQQYLKKKS